MKRVRRLRPAVLALALALAGPLAAHEVQHEVTRAEALVVRLAYADGEAFSYERYELYAGDAQRPVQSGRTDAQGRVAFVPGGVAHHRLRAFSEDGHGVDLRIETPPAAGGAAATMGPEPEPEPDSAKAPATARAVRVLAGLGIILGAFGVVQLYVRRRKAR